MLFSIFYPQDVINYNWLQLCPPLPCHSPHPHPSPGTPYQQSGTMKGPIRPPKQQHIPPKWSIFPEHPLLWVTTGSIDLKSKVKPTTHPPHPHPSPGTSYQQSGTTGPPIRPLKQQHIPPKQSIFPECLRSWITTGSIGPKSKVKPPTHLKGTPMLPECWCGVPGEE